MDHFNGKIGNAHAPCHVTAGSSGAIQNHIFGISESATQICLFTSLYNFHGATTTIKGSLHGSTHIVKRF